MDPDDTSHSLQDIEWPQFDASLNDDSIDVQDGEPVLEPLNLPTSLHSALALNVQVQKSLNEFKEKVIACIEENQRRQRDLEDGSKSGSESKRSSDVPPTSWSVTPSAIQVFKAPYFKDANGFHPPPNADVIARKNNGLMNQALIEPTKPFTKSEITKLQDVVLEFGMKKLLQPLMFKKETLVKEANILRELSEYLENKSELQQKEKEIAEVSNQVSELKESYTCPTLEESEHLDWMAIDVLMDSVHTDTECKVKWMNHLHPDINKSAITSHESAFIKRMVDSKSQDFDAIAEALSAPKSIRTAWQVASHYQTRLNEDVKKTGPLSRAEVLLLEVVVAHCRVGDHIPWLQVNTFIPGRTIYQLKHFWNKRNCVKTGEVWTELEDKVLFVAVKKFGIPNWNTVAHYVYGRTNRQCRERYALRLAIEGRKLGSWTKEEDEAIIESSEKHNFRWAAVEKEIPHRNARQIAQRYSLLMKHAVNDTNQDWVATTDVDQKPTRRKKSSIPNSWSKEMTSDEKTMSAFLEESREKLKRVYEVQNGLRPPDPEIDDPEAFSMAQAASIDQQISEIFAFYSTQATKTAYKGLERPFQNQQVYLQAKESVQRLLQGQELDNSNPFTAVVEKIFRQEVTRSVCDGEPVILPPNRITVRTLQGLLLQRDYLVKKVADAGYTEEQIKNYLPADTEGFEKLSKIFKALFFWPALCSITETPAMPEQPVQLPKKRLALRAQARERARDLSRDRDKQSMLLNSVKQESDLGIQFTTIRNRRATASDYKEFERLVHAYDSPTPVKKTPKVPKRKQEKSETKPVATISEPVRRSGRQIKKPKLID